MISSNLFQSQEIQQRKDKMSIQEWNHSQRQIMFGGHLWCKIQLLDKNNKKNVFRAQSEKKFVHVIWEKRAILKIKTVLLYTSTPPNMLSN